MPHAVALYAINPDGTRRDRLVVAAFPGEAAQAEAEAKRRAKMHKIHGTDEHGRYWFQDRDGQRYVLSVEEHHWRSVRSTW